MFVEEVTFVTDMTADEYNMLAGMLKRVMSSRRAGEMTTIVMIMMMMILK